MDDTRSPHVPSLVVKLLYRSQGWGCLPLALTICPGAAVQGVVYLTLTCNELTVVAWLFTLALTIEASMLWDGTKYFVGALIYIFALVRVYGYFLINKYYGQLQGFVSVPPSPSSVRLAPCVSSFPATSPTTP